MQSAVQGRACCRSYAVFKRRSSAISRHVPLTVNAEDPRVKERTSGGISSEFESMKFDLKKYGGSQHLRAADCSTLCVTTGNNYIVIFIVGGFTVVDYIWTRICEIQKKKILHILSNSHDSSIHCIGNVQG